MKYACMFENSELEELMKTFGETGGDKSIILKKDTAHLVASGNKILSMRGIEGLVVKAEKTATGIAASVRVLEGMYIPKGRKCKAYHGRCC
jgi:hypothetical protein